jgi:hypothetical protein
LRNYEIIAQDLHLPTTEFSDLSIGHSVKGQHLIGQAIDSHLGFECHIVIKDMWAPLKVGMLFLNKHEGGLQAFATL